MINLEKFYQSGYFQGDFLITTKKSMDLTKRFKALRFNILETNNYSLFTKGFDFPIKIGNTLFSGYAYTKNKSCNHLVTGPCTIDQEDISPQGEYYTLNIISKSEISIKTDTFGMYPIFYNSFLISNRLQLIYFALKELNQLQIFDAAINGCFLIENAFSQQQISYQTPIDGVYKLSHNKYIYLSEDKLLSIDKKAVSYNIGDNEEYWKHIDKAAEEICGSLEAILNSSAQPRMALTGGKDSRVAYAALVAMGRVDDVQLVTLDVGNDRLIASGLVEKFGGHYKKNKSVQSVLITNFEENLERFFSHYFFNRFYFPDFHLCDVLYTSQEREYLIGGLGGEIYRDFYRKIGFKLPQGSYTPQELCQFFQQTTQIEDDIVFKSAFSLAESTFEKLGGETFSDKLNSHYLEFRNVYHFGARLNKLNKLDVSPLLSEELYIASRILPDEIRDSGRVLFDITKRLCEEMAYCQYDTFSEDYSKIKFHKKSKYDGIVIPLKPNLDIYKDESDAKLLIAAKVNLFEKKREALTSLIEKLNQINNKHFLVTDKFIRRMKFLLDKKSRLIDKYLISLLYELDLKKKI